MTEQQLVAAFDDASLPPDQFTHHAHVRVAWWYLRRYGLAGATERFSVALRRFASTHGAPDKYDEAITVAYLRLIAERIDACPDAPWESFAAENPDLLSRRLVLRT